MADAHPPLLLLSGIGQMPWDWEGFLGAFGYDRPIQAPWLKGLRPGSTDRLLLEDMSDAVAQDATMQGWQQVDLVGMSLGAMVALGTSIRHPEQVRSQVLIAGQVSPPRSVLRAQRFALRFIPGSRLPKGLDKDRIREMFAALAEVDLAPLLDRVSARTLVVVGERDKVNRPASEQLAEQIAGARLVVMPGAGHQINVEQPKELAAVVRDFLGEGPGLGADGSSAGGPGADTPAAD